MKNALHIFLALVRKDTTVAAKFSIVQNCNLYPSIKEEGCWNPREETSPFLTRGFAEAQEAPQGVWSKQVCLELEHVRCSK